MVKLIFLCRRRPDIIHARYSELLLNGHVPLALRHHPTLRRYVVNIVEHVPAGAPPLDSIGELWFDSLDDFRDRLYDSQAGRTLIERDVQGFMGGADAYVTTEYVQKPGVSGVTLGRRTPGVKLICPIQRRAGMSHAEFVAHWLERHVPLALVHHPGFSQYVTNVVEQRLSDGGGEWDGISALHFASEQDWQERMYDSAAGARIIQADVARFIGRGVMYRVAEYIQR